MLSVSLHLALNFWIHIWKFAKHVEMIYLSEILSKYLKYLFCCKILNIILKSYYSFHITRFRKFWRSELLELNAAGYSLIYET